jgi:gliding motility-associated protein GldL
MNNSEQVSFFESAKWKRITGVAYSAGASVVIIGALFKIMHWPLAGLLLTIGMLTEAILFMLGVADKPHKENDWSRVFPQLADGEGESPKLGGKGLPSLETPAVSEADIEKLSGSIKKLTDTAGHLANFSSASSVTESYIKNVSAASDAVGAFSNSQRSLTESSAVLVDSFKGFASNMSAVSNDSKTFMEKIAALNNTLSSVNSTYELQLKNMSAQAETFSSVNASLEKITAVMDSSVKETEAYKEQTAKLTQQVSSLNNIYGNMLNAMNVRG